MTQILVTGSLPSIVVSDEFSPNTDELVVHNNRFAENFDDGDLAVAPIMRLAVVACMDSRMDIFKILGLENGEAHIVRNAGGVITDDVIRSLCLSQRFLGTREIILLHHTDCGLQMVSEDEFKAELEAELGIKPRWSLEPFADPYSDTRQSMQRLLLTPFVDAQHLRGFVYDVTDGHLHEVSQAE
jgi:carbonic anhydrase